MASPVRRREKQEGKPGRGAQRRREKAGHPRSQASVAVPITVAAPSPPTPPRASLGQARPTLATFAWGLALLAVALVALDGNLDALRGLLSPAASTAKVAQREPVVEAEPDTDVAERSDSRPAPSLPSLPSLASGKASPVAKSGVASPAASVGSRSAGDARSPSATASKTAFKGRPIEDACIASDPGGACVRRAMDSFYRALRRVDQRDTRAIARIAHFGDSIVAEDEISSHLRELLQERFGDAGAGFVYSARPSRWYQRLGVRHETTPWRVCSIVSSGGCDGAGDKQFGLGGASFSAAPAGSSSSFSTTEIGRPGDKVSSFELYYLRQPLGGSFSVVVDDQPVQMIDTASAVVESAFRRLEVPEGPHTLKLIAKGDHLRTFGIAMERSGPGIVYDSLGIVSNSAKALSLIEPEHWQEQLRHRSPDLVVVLLGTNEADWLAVSATAAAQYQATFGGLLGRIRSALPDRSCLVLSALDAATQQGRELVTKPPLPEIIEAQRRAAADKGCAFWDTFHWMGGEGSMAKWFDKGWVASDYTHPSHYGASRVATAVYGALMSGYDDFVLERGGREEPARQGRAPSIGMRP